MSESKPSSLTQLLDFMEHSRLSPGSSKAVSFKMHEWLAIALLIGVLGSLSIMAYIHKGEVGDKERLRPAFLSHKGKIEVLIEGSVLNSGVYLLPSGISMEEIFLLAQPNSKADLRRFNLKSQIKKGKTIFVPEQAMIVVYLKEQLGEAKEYLVPKGIRLMDLKEVLPLDSKINTKNLNKKRPIKNGETIQLNYN